MNPAILIVIVIVVVLVAVLIGIYNGLVQKRLRIDEAFAWEKRLQGWSHAKRMAFIEGGLDAVKSWSARTRAVARQSGG